MGGELKDLLGGLKDLPKPCEDDGRLKVLGGVLNVLPWPVDGP